MEAELRQKVKDAAVEYFHEKNIQNKGKEYIPVSGKLLDEDDLLNMIDASLDMWLTAGRFNREFETKFAEYLGAKHVLTTTSGSSANLLALTALTSPRLGERALKKGDEVITVAAGFPTTINTIIQNGLIPVFLDCEIGTYNIKTEDIEKAVTPKTRAIILAHTLGNMFDIQKIKHICEIHNLWLIEDSCDALGAEWNGKKAGTIGDIGTFSFYPAHHITMGEGGAVATNNSQLYKIIMSYRDWGRDCCCPPGHDGVCGKRFSQQHGKMPFGYDHKYIYSHAGYNLKITDWQAAVGLSQLEKLPEFLKKRNENAQYLKSKLKDLEDFLILPQVTEGTKSSWFGFLITLKEACNFTKQEMVEYLETNNIGTRQLFAGNILRQPYFTESMIQLRINNSETLLSSDLAEEHYSLLPNTEYIMNNTFWVGVHPSLGEAEMDIISDRIHEFVRKQTK
jgi:CDP-6-deoxy-D-xylo-4-hexulose-3-dehydrase